MFTSSRMIRERPLVSNDLTNNILYGRKDFIGFTLSEHAGLCKGGASLIGASIVVSYARRSLTTGGNVESSEGSSPANWQIDAEQETTFGLKSNNYSALSTQRRSALPLATEGTQEGIARRTKGKSTDPVCTRNGTIFISTRYKYMLFCRKNMKSEFISNFICIFAKSKHKSAD